MVKKIKSHKVGKPQKASIVSRAHKAKKPGSRRTAAGRSEPKIHLAKSVKKQSLFWKLFHQQKTAGAASAALAQTQPRTSQRPKIIRSQIDELLELVNEKGRITLKEISSKFKIDHALAEGWAKILEDAKLAELQYPAVGEADLVKAGYDEEQKKAVEKKREAAKAKPFFNFSFGKLKPSKPEPRQSPAKPSASLGQITRKKPGKPWFAGFNSKKKRGRKAWQWKF